MNEGGSIEPPSFNSLSNYCALLRRGSRWRRQVLVDLARVVNEHIRSRAAAVVRCRTIRDVEERRLKGSKIGGSPARPGYLCKRLVNQRISAGLVHVGVGKRCLPE